MSEWADLDLDDDFLGAEGGAEVETNEFGTNPLVFTKKESAVIVVDCHPAMWATMVPDVDAETGEIRGYVSQLTSVLRIVTNTIKLRIIASPSDKVSIVFINTRVTKNPTGAEGVFLLCPLQLPSATLIQQLTRLQDIEHFKATIDVAPSTAGTCRFSHALWSIADIVQDVPAKSVHVRVLLFTAVDDPTYGIPEERVAAQSRLQSLLDRGVSVKLIPMPPAAPALLAEVDADYKGRTAAAAEAVAVKAELPDDSFASLGLGGSADVSSVGHDSAHGSGFGSQSLSWHPFSTFSSPDAPDACYTSQGVIDAASIEALSQRAAAAAGKGAQVSVKMEPVDYDAPHKTAAGSGADVKDPKLAAAAADAAEAGVGVAARGAFNPAVFYSDILGEAVLDEASAMTTLEELQDAFRAKVFKKRVLTTLPVRLDDDTVAFGASVYVTAKPMKPEAPKTIDQDTGVQLTCKTTYVDASTQTVLEPSQISKYFPYSDRKLTFTDDDIKAVKTFPFSARPGLDLLGFKPASLVPPSLSLKPPAFLYPCEREFPGSTVAFNALLTKMAERGVVMICRLLARAGGNPRLVALFPQPERFAGESPLAALRVKNEAGQVVTYTPAPLSTAGSAPGSLGASAAAASLLAGSQADPAAVAAAVAASQASYHPLHAADTAYRSSLARSASIAGGSLQSHQSTGTRSLIQPPGMVMVYLPFEDDMRELKLEKTVPARPAYAAAASLVRALEKAPGEDGRAVLTRVPNPSLQRHYAVLQAIALNETEPAIPEDLLGMPASTSEKAEEAAKLFIAEIEALNDAPLGAAVKAPARKRAAAAAPAAGGGANDGPVGLGDMIKEYKEASAAGTLKKRTVAELKEFLKAAGLPVSGKKDELLARIDTYLASK